MTNPTKAQLDVVAHLKAKQADFKPISHDGLIAPTNDLQVGVYWITPEVALNLASAGDPNRAVSPASRDAYLQDMLAGRWNAPGNDALVFDAEGALMNGQHRMGGLAKTKAIVPDFPGLPFLVVRGMDRAAMETMDAGRKRTVADQLNIGRTNETKLGTKIVSALRALYLIGQAGSGGKLGGGKLTNAAMFELFRKHPEIVKSVEYVAKKSEGEDGVQVRPAVVAAIHYISQHLAKGLKGRGDAFVEVLRSGVPTADYTGSDPAHALYVRWANLQATGRVSENDALKIVAMAWNLYADKKPAPKVLKVPAQMEPVTDGTDKGVITRTTVTGEAPAPVAEPEAPKPEAAAVKAPKTTKATTAKAPKADKPKAEPKVTTKGRTGGVASTPIAKVTPKEQAKLEAPAGEQHEQTEEERAALLTMGQ